MVGSLGAGLPDQGLPQIQSRQGQPVQVWRFTRPVDVDARFLKARAGGLSGVNAMRRDNCFLLVQKGGGGRNRRTAG
jgi:hypothetical protein